MNGRNKKFLDNAFFLASASDFKHPLDRYPGDHHTVLCDGSERVDRILRSSMLWDVMGGVARRSWARNPHAMETSAEFNESHADGYHITLPHIAEDDLINKVLKNKGIN